MKKENPYGLWAYGQSFSTYQWIYLCRKPDHFSKILKKELSNFIYLKVVNIFLDIKYKITFST